jgi:hypothetical protein
MGVHHEDGYSASVEGYFVIGERRIRLAKTNGGTFVLAEPLEELGPGTAGELVVIVDGEENVRSVAVVDGIIAGQTTVGYKVIAPF